MARPIGEINSAPMADLAFLMLVFFLVVTTMDVSSGLARRLPPMPDEENQDQPQVHRRNIMVVLINRSDRLFAGNQPMEINMLREAVKEFILNPANELNKPEKELTYLEGIGEFPVSKGIISLQNDRGTSYNAYIQVQNELVAAFNELRNDLSMVTFGRVFVALDNEQQEIIRRAIPQNISEAEPRDVGATRR